MKINDWSVVKSPAGVSLRHVKGAERQYEVDAACTREICIHHADGQMRIRVYDDGIDEPLCEFSVPAHFYEKYSRLNEGIE